MRMNEVYTEQGLAFDQIMPANYVREFGDRPEHTFRIPYGAKMLEGGKVEFSIFAPKAQNVTIKRAADIWELEKKDGIFVGTADVGYGFSSLNILFDGNEVLYPMLPVGYGFSRPVNYVDVPTSEQEFFEIQDVPHGTVCQQVFYSEVTGRYEKCLVYLPPCYFEENAKKYPVLYLQHGHGENENCWVNQGKVNYIFDNLLAGNKAVPAVIVMNNGMVQMEKDGERYVNSRIFEDYLLKDVIPFIEKKFRVYTDREHRAMAGLSMGSMQTSVVTFRNQDKFAWAGLFSGFMRDMMNDNRDHLQFAGTYNQNMKLFFRAMGEQDFFMEAFKEDDAICSELGLTCTRKTYPGNHEWNVWRMCIRDFLQMIFQDI